METVKRLFISLLVLLGCSAGAWAIEQDTDGYYLIGSVQDWKDFAELVNNGTNTAANARMTADIDLGDDQTMVGDGYYFVDNNQRPFKGIFDGQGHTLTIHYVTAEVVKKYSAAGIAEPQYLGCAPFGYVWGGTIRNLRTAGTITATHEGVAGIVAYTYNNPLIENCRSSVDITFTDNHRGAGGITYFNYGNQLTINNCLFDGTITGGSNATGSAGFVVYRYENATGDIYIKNSLMAGTFVNLGPNDCCTFVRYSDHAQITNSYYTTALGTVQGTQATAEQLADGTIAYKLQANREDLVWGQRIGIDPEPVLTNDESYRVYKCINGGYTNDPDLAYPGLQQDADGNYLIGSVLDWQEFAAVVATTNDAKAKMIADVDLGDDQTTIGHPNESPSYHFKGVFDGQGYTLTVHYVKQGEKDICSPFPNISNATIKNIHITGTIESSTACQPAAIGCVRYGTSTIENVWSSVELTSTKSSWCEASGLVGCVDGYKNGHLVMTNCMVSGNIKSSGSYEGCFIGFINSGGSATVSNCLSVANFEYSGTSGFMGNYTNCYVKQFPSTIPSDMRVTDEQLADGTIAAALGDGWAQDPLTHQPVPKIFTTVQDEDGYYLIGSVQDWKRFAELVNSGTNTAANAKMTADVDLGDDQTYISPDWHGEFSNLHYHGTFDGQGHTLTVHYNSDKYFHTPFSQTSGATIKNLHVAGTIKSTSSGPSHMSGLISNSAGNDVIQNVWVSADITGGSHSWIECGAFIGCNNCGNSTITDCLFTGSITTTGGNNGCFAGWVQSYNPSSITTTNCLSTGTFNIGSGSVSRGTLNNCYVKSYPYSIPSAMQVTDEQLADGTIATALQADRSEEIWVQDPELGIPMLKIFANEETEQPSEALNGIFTINASGEKVSFAKGNLQKIGSTYQFAEHQYDYFGTDQSDTHRDMYAFLNYSNPDNGESWSMLSRDEWGYLFATRSVTNTLSADARYTMATLGGTYKGLIIFPDNYTHPEGTGFTSGVFNSNSNYTAQVSLEGWAMMEAAGCVFLPAAGYCSRGSTWVGVGNEGSYMSTTPDGSNNYYDPYFTPNSVNLYESSSQRTWSSIRLVLRLQPLTYTVPASGVGTFSSEVNIHLPEGLSAHYCKTYYAERSAISVVSISSGVVPANTGVLLSGTPGETFNLYPTPETADELEGNALVAVTKPVHINPTKGDYTNFMMKGGRFVKIADESYTVKMPANRAYLPLLTSAISGSNVKEIMLYWDDEEATGIERMRNVENEIMRKGNIYNLNGQKLSSPLKGINIINGRKVIVK